MVVSVFAAAGFVWLASVISLEDWRTGKIRNRNILFGLAVCACALCGLLLMSAVHSAAPHLPVGGVIFKPANWVSSAPAWKFYGGYCLHAALGLLAGAALWKAGYWPAGDAKLYILFCLMLPLIDPAIGFYPAGLFFVLLVNIFIPACAWYVLHFAVAQFSRLAALPKSPALWILWINGWLESRKGCLKHELAGWLFFLFNFSALFCFSRSLRTYAQYHFVKFIHSEAVAFVILFLVWNRIYGLLMRRSTALFFAILLGGYFVIGQMLFPDRIYGDLGGAGLALRIFVLLVLLKGALNWYFTNVEVRRIPLAELEPGMVLSDDTMSRVRRDAAFHSEYFRDSYADGLTAAQAAGMKVWGGESMPGVCHVKPFAGWISLGAALTLLMGMDVMNYFSLHCPNASRWAAAFLWGR